MSLQHRPLIVLAALGLAIPACTSRPATEAEGESEDTGTGGSTSSPDPTNPNPTLPGDDDTGVMTSDGTGEPTTGPAPTTGPSDTTEGGGGEGCCATSPEPGCDEPDVVDCVCAQEASCCAFEWSEVCVDLAMGKCEAVCEGPGGESTGDDPTDTDDPPPPKGACEDIETFEMLPSEATHSGAWFQTMSMVGEGEISVYQGGGGGGGGGSVLYEPDIPCADTWYIWVRYWEDGDADSYFATLDGEPNPEAIFEGDCTPGGDGYSWGVLNWRDQAANACEYVEDPWTPTWDAGVHEIEFSFRESFAMGRILLTNDPTLVP